MKKRKLKSLDQLKLNYEYTMTLGEIKAELKKRTVTA